VPTVGLTARCESHSSSYRDCHESNLYASDILLVSSVDRCGSPRAGRFDPNRLLRLPLAFPVCMPLRIYPSKVSKFIHAYQIVMVKNVRGTDIAKKSQAFWVYSRVMPPDASSFCLTNWVEKKFLSVRILQVLKDLGAQLTETIVHGRYIMVIIVRILMLDESRLFFSARSRIVAFSSCACFSRLWRAIIC
jgi:hypothetical protein